MSRSLTVHGGQARKNRYRPSVEACEARSLTTGGIAGHATAVAPVVERVPTVLARSSSLHAVITFRNGTKESMSFQFRFTTLSSSTTLTLAPGERRNVSVPYSLYTGFLIKPVVQYDRDPTGAVENVGKSLTYRVVAGANPRLSAGRLYVFRGAPPVQQGFISLR